MEQKVSPERLQKIFREEVIRYDMERYGVSIRYGYTRQFHEAEYTPADKMITVRRGLDPTERRIRTLIRHEFKHVRKDK